MGGVYHRLSFNNLIGLYEQGETDMREIKRTLQAKLKTGCMVDRSARATSHHADVSEEEYNYSQLAFAIVEQAVEDYKTAKKNGKSTKKLESFFKSKWCDELLRLIPLDGREILDYLSKEFEQGEISVNDKVTRRRFTVYTLEYSAEERQRNQTRRIGMGVV